MKEFPWLPFSPVHCFAPAAPSPATDYDVSSHSRAPPHVIYYRMYVDMKECATCVRICYNSYQ